MDKRKAITIGLVLIAVGAYFINVEVQSYLGRQVISDLSFTVNPLDEALVQAKGQSKMVLADLSAIWCPSCRKLDKQVFSNVKVSDVIKRDYVFARVEYESQEGEAFMERYGVTGFPNLVVLDGDGNLIKKLAVTFNADQFLKNLNR